MPNGRPPAYSDEKAEQICSLLASGISLREICDQDGMPAQSTVYLWVANDTGGFSEKYARAREAQQLYYADEIIEIADDGRNDWVQRKIKGQDVVLLDKEHISRSGLRVESRKWLMARLARRTFGEKAEVAHSGAITIAGLIEGSYKLDKES
jgi:hypothetical protein